MKKNILFWSVTLFTLTGLSTLAQANAEALYTVHSKDVGWESLDTTISEKERHEQSSLLEITRHGQTSALETSALEGKFLFCYVYRLTQKRGFPYAKWSKATQDTKDVFVIFLEDKEESMSMSLKEQCSNYSFYDHPMGLEELEWKKLQKSCGF
jgi:hypothetical protein